MKKFASITIAMLMVVSMMLSSIVSTSARTAGTGITQSKGSITLTKFETESSKTEPVDGATFVAYKVMTLTADTEGDATFTVDSDLTGVITADDLVHTGKVGATGKLYKSTKALEGKIPQIEALKGKLEATTFAATGNGTGEYKATDLGLGVYLVVETVVPEGYIKDTQSFLVSIPEWNNATGQWVYDIAAQPKNKPITLDKKIKDPDKNGDLVNEAVFAIGNVVEYSVTAQIPNYGTVASDPNKKYSEYLKEQDEINSTNKYGDLFISFKDTFADGLTFVEDSIVVYTDNVNFTEGDYDVTVNGQTFEIKFSDWDVLKDHEGETITVEYKAVLNEGAAIESENKNEVTYEFVNDPDTGETEQIVDPAYVFTYEMNLNKTFEGKTAADAGVNPTVVTFKLYRKGSTTPMEVVDNGNGSYTVYEKQDDKYAASKTPVQEIKLSSTGSLSVKGLEEGTYLLEETKTVEGYAIPTTQIEIVLGEDGIKKTGYVHLGVEPTHCTGDGAAAPLRLVAGKTNTFEVDVNNVIKQFTLPTTGGDGLLIFTIAGGILMAAAIILFTTLRKKSTCK